MALSRHAAIASPHAEDDLTDEQMEQMLAAASARLQAKAKDQQLTKKSDKQSLVFPKLDTGDLQKPYVSTKGDIATIDSSRLLADKHRKQANAIRKVEDPVVAKKAAEEVRRHNALYTTIPWL